VTSQGKEQRVSIEEWILRTLLIAGMITGAYFVFVRLDLLVRFYGGGK
jgi:hypothetical protein